MDECWYIVVFDGGGLAEGFPGLYFSFIMLKLKPCTQSLHYMYLQEKDCMLLLYYSIIQLKMNGYF